MSTDVIVRNTEDLPQNHARHELNENPIAPQNLSFTNKLSKGKYPVYLTTSKINSQKYVMKVFSDPARNCDKHYNNEARFASLSHPNIINIVHFEANKTIVQDGQFMRASYILSEYAPHGDFFEFIVNNKDKIDEKLTRTYFRQLIDGIEYLHAIGIAHLDLKPENLLLGADFSLKIADFDLSYVTGDEKILSRGTKRYRGPEFYNSTSSTFKLDTPSAADIYSAGIILFVLKSGGMYPHSENRLVEGVNFTELLEKNSSKFWSKHCEIQGKPKGFFDKKFIKLFQKMVKADPSQRATLKKIKKSKWYNGPVYTASELQLKMKTILGC